MQASVSGCHKPGSEFNRQQWNIKHIKFRRESRFKWQQPSESRCQRRGFKHKSGLWLIVVKTEDRVCSPVESMWDFDGRSNIERNCSWVSRFSLPIIILLPLLSSAPPPLSKKKKEEIWCKETFNTLAITALIYVHIRSNFDKLSLT